MRCHYEVFELPRNTTNDEIKKQYKKLALKYHPDKNVGNEENSTELFKELQVAYAVLNDPNERKWYDDHRESILRGGDGTAGSGDSEIPDSPLIDLMRYFNSSCYNGFSDDDPKSFYTIYGNLFVEIHNIDFKEEDHVPAAFHLGNSSSSNSEVQNFYSHWINFVSNLSFSWEDKYNTTDAPNRLVKRAMEKENKKLRDVARKKYIDTVRTLATHVQRRDPRIVKMELERKKKEEDELKRRNQLKLDEKERKRLQREKWRNYQETDEEKATRERERKGAFLLVNEDDEDDNKKVYDNEENNNYDESGMIEDCNIQNNIEREKINEEIPEIVEKANDQILRCEICNKDFRADSQLQQHLQSKVHNKKVQEMNKQQKKNKGKGKDSKSPSINSINQQEELNQNEQINEEVCELNDIRIEEQEILENDNNRKKESQEETVKIENSLEKDFNTQINEKKINESESSDDESDFEDLKILTQNLKKKKTLAIESSDSEDSQNNRKNRNIKSNKGKKTKQSKESTKKEKIISNNDVRVEELFGDEPNIDQLKNDEQDQQHTCKVCGYNAPSNNKLYQHIQQTGHAALKEVNGMKVEKKKKKDKN